VSGFLGKEPSPEWRARWKEFDNYARDLALRSNTAGVPFAVTAVPDRAEASLISARDWPLDVDPFAFGRRVRSAAESHGCVYLDLLPAFRNVPAAGRLYYPVDGHVNSNGDALIARLLADRLTNGIFPSLKKDEAELPAGRGSH